MFTPILKQLLRQKSPYNIDLFIAYFQHHIDLDGGKYSQKSQSLLVNLCGDDANKWQEATEGAFMLSGYPENSSQIRITQKEEQEKSFNEGR